MTLIQLENVGKIFSSRKGDVEAVRGFSLSIRKGEVVTLVGASGCGKTTVLNMVAGFTAPTTGNIFLEGEPVSRVEPRCGMIFQSYALFPWLTVKKNVVPISFLLSSQILPPIRSTNLAATVSPSPAPWYFRVL